MRSPWSLGPRTKGPRDKSIPHPFGYAQGGLFGMATESREDALYRTLCPGAKGPRAVQYGVATASTKAVRGQDRVAWLTYVNR